MHNTNNIEMHSKENETKSSVMVSFKGTKQMELHLEKIDLLIRRIVQQRIVHQ
jgi:hypothetical protein